MKNSRKASSLCTYFAGFRGLLHPYEHLPRQFQLAMDYLISQFTPPCRVSTSSSRMIPPRL